jgi:hypothetical protein
MATVTTGQPGLKAARSEIEIRPNFGVLKNASIRVAAGEWVGTFSVLIGVVLIALSWRERRKICRDLERAAQ